MNYDAHICSSGSPFLVVVVVGANNAMAHGQQPIHRLASVEKITRREGSAD